MYARSIKQEYPLYTPSLGELDTNWIPTGSVGVGVLGARVPAPTWDLLPMELLLPATRWTTYYDTRQPAYIFMHHDSEWVGWWWVCGCVHACVRGGRGAQPEACMHVH